jgi:uncharacterized protein (DUF4415 family)
VPELFGGPTLEIVDDRRDYRETRIVCSGKSEAESTSSSIPGAERHAGSLAREKAMRKTRKNITRVSAEQARLLKDETDYARLDAMTDADIAKAVAEDPDAAPLDLDWTQARLSLPPGKDIVTLRLDRDVLAWFRAQGDGYQTRINQVLRAYYDADARRKSSAADVVAPVKASGRGANVWKHVLRRKGEGGFKHVSKPVLKKAAAKKRPGRTAKPATTVAKHKA